MPNKLVPWRVIIHLLDWQEIFYRQPTGRVIRSTLLAYAKSFRRTAAEQAARGWPSWFQQLKARQFEDYAKEFPSFNPVWMVRESGARYCVVDPHNSPKPYTDTTDQFNLAEERDRARRAEHQRDYRAILIGGIETCVRRDSNPRFVVMQDHWYGRRWSMIGDRQTEDLWFVDEDARRIRPWKYFGENLQDSANYCGIKYDTIPHPPHEAVLQRFKERYGRDPIFGCCKGGLTDDGMLGFLIMGELFNESIPQRFDNVEEFARWHHAVPFDYCIIIQDSSGSILGKATPIAKIVDDAGTPLVKRPPPVIGPHGPCPPPGHK